MAKTVATKNNADNVSSSKGVKGGYIFSAPVGTELPKDIKTPLNVAFKVLGYISSDGYKETIDSDSEDILDMNGDLLDLPKTSRVESGQVTFAEIKAETLKIQYGEKNVTDENGIYDRPPQRRFRDHPQLRPRIGAEATVAAGARSCPRVSQTSWTSSTSPSASSAHAPLPSST